MDPRFGIFLNVHKQIKIIFIAILFAAGLTASHLQIQYSYNTGTFPFALFSSFFFIIKQLINIQIRYPLWLPVYPNKMIAKIK